MINKILFTKTEDVAGELTPLYGWGFYTGDGTNINKSSPVQIGTNTNWTSLSLGSTNRFAINTSGELYAWGTAGSTHGYQDMQSWLKVSLGETMCHAIRSDGALFTWGLNNSYGTLGDGTTVYKTEPTQIGTSSWSHLASGFYHTLAIRSDGALFAWGHNSDGQLGDGTTVDKSSPIQIGTSSWIYVDAGAESSFGITSDYKLFAWGLNSSEQLGVLYKDTDSWEHVEYSSDGGIALKTDGSLWAWSNSGAVAFACGLGSTSIIRSSPIQIGTSSWSKFSLSASQSPHVLAIRSDGALFAWGGGGNGKLGDGTTVSKSSPVQIGTSSWAYVSAGASHSLAITTDGALFAWGAGANGRLGDGTTVSKSSPVQIGTSSWIYVSAGLDHSAAIRTDGALFTWGYNGTSGLGGQLGDGTTVSKSSPVQIGTSSWIHVVAAEADSHTLAIRSDGALFTWGENSNGELGIGIAGTLGRSSPVQVGTSSWSYVTAGSATSAAIRSDGALFTWGYNLEYALGDSTTVSKSSPVQIGTSSWTMVAFGFGNIAGGVTTTNEVYTWGKKQYAHADLGIASSNYPRRVPTQMLAYISRNSPVQVGTSSWTMVNTSSKTGSNTTFGITVDGGLWGWGDADYGILTVGPSVSNSSLFGTGSVPLKIGTSSWLMVGVNKDGFTAHAIAADGTLWGWGLGANGRLGDSTTVSKVSPVQIGTSSWTKIYKGSNANAFAIRIDGTLFAWGPSNTNYSLGLSTTASSPVQVGSSSWTLVYSYDNTAFGITSNNRLFFWGYEGTYQQRTGSGIYNAGWNDVIGPIQPFYTSSNRSSPTKIGDKSWIMVASANSDATVGISNDGGLWAWGSNTAGQLGDGTSISLGKTSPIKIGTSSWAYVSTGASYVLAIRTDGALFAWGWGASGRLGDGTITNKSSPVQIGTSSWAYVAAGRLGASAGITTDGALFTWGLGTGGIIGDGTTISKSSPVQIGSSSWSKVAIGDSFMLAIRTDGGLFRWGNASVVGASSSSPVQVGTSSWSQVYAGHTHALAIRTDGALFAWGLNSSGQIGDGTTVNKNSPVQIGTLSWNKLPLGTSASNGSLAIRKG